MQVLENITNEARQKHTILLADDSSRIVLELTYKPMQIGWFLDVTYEDADFIVRGLRVVTSTNLLNQWRNKLPFGIMVQCKDSQDPLLLEDFLVKRAALSILSKEEVQQIVEMNSEIKAQD